MAESGSNSNVSSIIIDQISSLDLDKILREQVELRIDKTIKDLIEDQFRFGDIRNNLKEYVKRCLHFDPKKVEVRDYHEYLAEEIHFAIMSKFSKPDLIPLKTLLDSVVGEESEEEIEFKDFIHEIERICDNIYEYDDPCNCENKSFTVSIKSREYSWSDNWFNLEVSKKDEHSYMRSKEELLSAVLNEGVWRMYRVNYEYEFSELYLYLKRLSLNKTIIKNIEEWEGVFATPPWES